MSARENTNLPSGWVWTKFGSICKVQGGFAFKSNEYQKSGIPLVRISNLVNGQVSFESDTVYLQQSKLTTHRNFILNKGDTLIAMSGATTGKMANFELEIPALLNQRVGRFQIASESVCAPRFISLLVQQITKKVLKEAYGAAQPNISPNQIEQMEIPLPPLDEQHGIVAEIEKQFTRLDAGVASLKRVQVALKRYRASVLKAACEGRLVPTEAELARREGRSYELATELLARTLRERRARSSSIRSYKEPTFPKVADLQPVPEGWAWATFDQIAKRVTVGHVGPMKHEYVADGIPFLRSQNVRENRFDPEGLLYIRSNFHTRLAKSVIRPGDLAVVRSGSVGTTCVIPETLGEANCADLVLIQEPLGFVPQYGAYYMNSLAKRHVNAGKVGVALTHFNTKSVAALPIPLPPLAEQLRIVAEVERRLSVIDEMEAIVSANLKRTDRLRQSVLHSAFSGNLVC